MTMFINSNELDLTYNKTSMKTSSNLDLIDKNKLNTYFCYDKVLNIGETSYRKWFFFKEWVGQGYLGNILYKSKP